MVIAKTFYNGGARVCGVSKHTTYSSSSVSWAISGMVMLPETSAASGADPIHENRRQRLDLIYGLGRSGEEGKR